MKPILKKTILLLKIRQGKTIVIGKGANQHRCPEGKLESEPFQSYPFRDLSKAKERQIFYKFYANSNPEMYEPRSNLTAPVVSLDLI